MVAILVKIFGPSHLATIEDALQDTFLKASLQWRQEMPHNPEAWFIAASKNRVLDLLRQIRAREQREADFPHSSVAREINEYFLDHEVEDSQLRMLFLACNPSFSRSEQICFALKTISGFSQKEIANALLEKEETIKKRLQRARQKIKAEQISLSYPAPSQIEDHLQGVQQIIYLIFNEGFHSNRRDSLINKDLCGEALRLCKLLLSKENFRSGAIYALFALLCFNSSRLESKVSNQEIVDLKNQDRSQWYLPLIQLGRDSLMRSLADFEDRSAYHYEALIAYEHIKASSFEATDWSAILDYYQQLYKLLPHDAVLLSRASVLLQMKKFEAARQTLNQIEASKLAARAYLYEAAWAELYSADAQWEQAKEHLQKAIKSCSNQLEQDYLKKKLADINKV